MSIESSINRFGPYQVVSEPSILGFGGLNPQNKEKIMDEEEEMELLYEGVASLKKQMQESDEKVRKSLCEIRAMVEDLVRQFPKPAVGVDLVRQFQKPVFSNDSLHASFGRNHIPIGNLYNKLTPNWKSRSRVNVNVNVRIDDCKKMDDFTCEEVLASKDKAYEGVLSKMEGMEGLQLTEEMPKSELEEEQHQVFDERSERNLIQEDEVCFINTYPSFLPSDSQGVGKTLGLMVAASPCVFSIAPLTFATATSALERKEIVLKGGHVLDVSASCQPITFDDQTGTLMIAEFIWKAPAPIHGHFSNNEKQIASFCVPRRETSLVVAAGRVVAIKVMSLQEHTLGVPLCVAKARQTPLPPPEPPPQQSTMAVSTAVLEDKDCFKGGVLLRAKLMMSPHEYYVFSLTLLLIELVVS